MLLEAQILPSDIDWFGLVCYFNLGLTYFISFLSAGVLPSLPYVTVIYDCLNCLSWDRCEGLVLQFRNEV